MRQRDAGRDKHVFGIWGHLDAELRRWPQPRPGIWLDTTTLPVEQTVDSVHAALDAAAV